MCEKRGFLPKTFSMITQPIQQFNPAKESRTVPKALYRLTGKPFGKLDERGEIRG